MGNNITKCTVDSLGYGFIAKEYLPEGKDEYYLRNMQNKSGINYRKLSAYEIEMLVRNGNTCDNWNNFLVSDAFNPELVKNCKFYGLVRIGKLESFCLEFSDLRVPVGLYNSTIISCDFGDNVVIQNCNYISHYIIGSEVIIVNVNELATTNHAKFGNGILKEGEDESVRVWMEVCNENGGRSVIPFNGMLPGDAYLWSKFRNNDKLQEKFKEFTEKKFNKTRGYYGKVGDRTVIKNCKILKDVFIGTDAYLKGANKIKNVTVNSSFEAPTQIGEGCEIVNGIIDYGCKIFYGVKAVRFILASHSQLKYGARLINSYLGNNATISCCEVLNSLIFPSHEQHHNNSFLCAALVMGQSNIAAGATIGSNHNSRGADGEIIAGRGFWPGLCVSLKHNSKFASFTILAKGDYPAELDISIPFSLVSNDVTNDQLIVMPGYWFMYNMYALARNSWKYVDRDKRTDIAQLLEYDFLAPDTVNEMFDSIAMLELLTGKAYARTQNNQSLSDDEYKRIGKQLLGTNDSILKGLEITTEGFENSKRKVVIAKAAQSYSLFKELIQYYGVLQLIRLSERSSSYENFTQQLSNISARETWMNVGGQLIPAAEVKLCLDNITSGKYSNWDQVHEFYREKGKTYDQNKTDHALSSLSEILDMDLHKLTPSKLNSLFDSAVHTKEWMVKGIHDSRAKDYDSSFRKMVYESTEEMNKVIGRLDKNSFIKQEQAALEEFRSKINSLKSKFKQATVTA